MSQEQLEKKGSKLVEGEALDIIIGNKPLVIDKAAEESDKDNSEKGAMKDKVKANILKILSETYGFDENDFLSAELEVVPAGKAMDAGFDRSMM